IRIVSKGSETAFSGLREQQADIGMASRPVQPKEEAKPAWAEHVLAFDGIAIVVSSKNQVKALSLQQIAGIFSGGIKDWSKVGGAPGPSHVYARNNESGTYETLVRLVLSPYKASLIGTAVRESSSSELVHKVAADPQGIGFAGQTYAKEKGVTTLDIQE